MKLISAFQVHRLNRMIEGCPESFEVADFNRDSGVYDEQRLIGSVIARDSMTVSRAT